MNCCLCAGSHGLCSCLQDAAPKCCCSMTRHANASLSVQIHSCCWCRFQPLLTALASASAPPSVCVGVLLLLAGTQPCTVNMALLVELHALHTHCAAESHCSLALQHAFAKFGLQLWNTAWHHNRFACAVWSTGHTRCSHAIHAGAY
jgi:hypothetical protein